MLLIGLSFGWYLILHVVTIEPLCIRILRRFMSNIMKLSTRGKSRVACSGTIFGIFCAKKLKGLPGLHRTA
jgi:hypothetical protein